MLANVNAQFTDDMESYTDGQPISGAHWTDLGCGGGAGCAIMSSSAQAHEGSLSGLIPDDTTTDAILDLGSKIFDYWCLEFFMYVPSNKEAYWRIKGCVPICTEDWDIDFFFNQNLNSPGEGKIINSTTEDITFNFPHDEWFRIEISWDISTGISLATWGLLIDNNSVIASGTPFTSADGIYPSSLGGINFFSISTNNQYYLDTFLYLNGDCGLIISTEDFNSKEFSAIPNPVGDILKLSANEEIISISITNILGQEIYSQKVNALSSTIDMSSFSKGTYFVKAIIGDTTGTIKIIK